MQHSCSGKKILKFFKAACDSNRHAILDVIKRQGRANVSEITKKIGLSQPTISHHLKILADAELIVSKKQGKETFFSLDEKSIKHCCHGFLGKYCDCGKGEGDK